MPSALFTLYITDLALRKCAGDSPESRKERLSTYAIAMGLATLLFGGLAAAVLVVGTGAKGVGPGSILVVLALLLSAPLAAAVTVFRVLGRRFDLDALGTLFRHVATFNRAVKSLAVIEQLAGVGHCVDVRHYWAVVQALSGARAELIRAISTAAILRRNGVTDPDQFIVDFAPVLAARSLVGDNPRLSGVLSEVVEISAELSGARSAITSSSVGSARPTSRCS